MPLAARTVRAALCAALFAPPAAASAQIITVKTLPVAEGDQFDFLPSANLGMGGVSLAISDSLLDAFVNPAKGGRLRAARFFGSPSFYSVSRSAGGGQTLPIGGLVSDGRTFGGAVVAIQALSPSEHDPQFIATPGIFTVQDAGTPSFPIQEQRRTQQNRYVFGMLGTRLTSGMSVAASVLYANLHRIDGVDQLYAGSQSVAQAGGDLDARIGVVRDWESGATVEALLLHERLSMTHDVTFADAFYDPNIRTTTIRPRLEHNLDRTNTWGLQLGWQRPVGDSGWRVGATVIGNLLTHPKLPDYQIVDVVRPVPWDPGHSAAYNFGVGVSQRRGPSTFALDLIYEPILSHTWGEAPNALVTADGGIIPPGGRTTENHFTFSNAIARLGLGQDLLFDGITEPLRLQGGVATHVIHYWMHQDDHVAGTSRRQEEQWLEWSPTWGASMKFGSVDVRYLGRVTHGTGRPGIQSTLPDPRADVAAAVGSSILAAPSGPLTLTPVSVTTHQLSIAVPLP
jgi:hypothetical protein